MYRPYYVMKISFVSAVFMSTIGLAIAGLAVERAVISDQKHQSIKKIFDETRPLPKGSKTSLQALQVFQPNLSDFQPDVSPKDAVRIGDYVFENTAQVIVPPAKHAFPAAKPGEARPPLMILPPPMAVISLGGNPGIRLMSLQPGSKPENISLPLNKPSLKVGRTKAQIELGTDNQILKLKDGSLLAIRNCVIWEDAKVKPAWWDKVTIQGKPHGARVAVVVWWSADGRKWERRGVIDPLDYEKGRYSVPRPVEDNCPGGCFGGWDRTEAYADPWSGELYATMDAVGGPIVNYKIPGGRSTDPRKETQFLFKSIDGGKSWHEIMTFYGWTPIVISSTPNGRVYLYSNNNTQPTLIYSTKNNGLDMAFSQGYPVNIKNVVVGGDDLYGKLVYKATNSISRISTDASTSKVRLSYPTIDSDGKTAIAVMEAEIKDDRPEPYVTPICIVQGKNGASVLASQFVDGDPQAATQLKSNVAMLYWAEGSPGDKGTGRVRCMLFDHDRGHSQAFDVSGEYSPAVSLGHYMASGSYEYVGRQYFFLHWDQPDGIYGNVVGVKLAKTPK